MPRCKSLWLEYDDSFITARGAEEVGLGRTRFILNFVLARAIRMEMLIQTTAIIADTEAYDAILGMDF